MAGTPGPMMSPQPGGDMRGPGQDSLGPYAGMGLNGDFPSSMGGQVFFKSNERPAFHTDRLLFHQGYGDSSMGYDPSMHQVNSP